MAAALSAALSGCVATGTPADVQSEYASASVPPAPAPQPIPIVGPSCHYDRYFQPAPTVTKKIDLLFLVDTANSRRTQRESAAAKVGAFLDAMPSDADYRVGVVLAHGSRSSWSGRLFSAARSGSAKVLRSTDMSAAAIAAALENDILHVEPDEADGEQGTWSMARALDDDRLAESRALGFFRDDSALAVIAITGNADVCSDYVNPSKGPNEHASDRAKEVHREKSGNGCVRAAPAHRVGGAIVRPGFEEELGTRRLIEQAREVMAGRPVFFGILAYDEPGRSPDDDSDAHRNGSGGDTRDPSSASDAWVGYVEADGALDVKVMLSSYADVARMIGGLATVRVDLISEFPVSRLNADPTTLAVKVDGVASRFEYLAESNHIRLIDPGTALSTIDVTYCELAPAPGPSPSLEPSPTPLPSPEPSPTPLPSPSVTPAPSPTPLPSPEPSPSPLPSPSAAPSPIPTLVPGVDPLCQAGAFVPKSALKVGLAIDPAEGSSDLIVTGLTAALGVTPIVYADAEVASGKPALDGVTVLAISRKVVVSATTDAFVQGVRDFVAQGGSLVAEYDGAALLFRTYANLSTSLTGHFSPSLGLFDGNVSGGGLVLPAGYSVAYAVDASDPIWLGLPAQLENTGYRAAFAVSGQPEWVHTVATFQVGTTPAGVPAGYYPAVMGARCGSGRVAIFTMNHFQALTADTVKTLVRNAFNWVIGN